MLLINLSFLIAQPTGISTYANQLLPQLQPLNPTLLTAQKISGYNCYEIPPNLTPDLGSKGQINRLIWTQFNLPKIYHQLSAKLLFSPLPEAPLFTNCRHIVTVHDLIPLHFPQKLSRFTAYYKYYIPQVLKQAQHIICDSHATAQDVHQFCHISANKMTVIPLAYDATKYYPMNLPTSNYFIYTGRHDPHKNLPNLISAFASLPNYNDYELWLVGPPNMYTPDLIKQVKELGLQSQIKFLGYVSETELPILINQAIALVLPSLWEGFGLPVLEAMACGTPVITSNLSSLPEVAGDAAILINPNNVAEIRDAMHSVVSNLDFRSQLRSASLIRASQFSWAKTGEATINVLQKYL